MTLSLPLKSVGTVALADSKDLILQRSLRASALVNWSSLASLANRPLRKLTLLRQKSPLNR